MSKLLNHYSAKDTWRWLLIHLDEREYQLLREKYKRCTLSQLAHIWRVCKQETEKRTYRRIKQQPHIASTSFTKLFA